MTSQLNTNIPPLLAIPHQLSDHLPVGTQPNDQMISNEMNFPKLYVIPHYLKAVGTKSHNHNDLTDENYLNHNHPKSRQQIRIIGYMNKTEGQLGLYNPKFLILTLDKKKDLNFSFLKLIPQKILP
ncbi:hypothetical protein O181_128127 [Austropuccinia psidii MF-1]|uniref:Uncharacterized protein n=1 Tax=Austropuccinia psidii MF-1 TaxID=1389203 RepID=A0A9Q3QA61_9BASI|nr:hypothetical protein [Austropuccinia psidii MF-1]